MKYLDRLRRGFRGYRRASYRWFPHSRMVITRDVTGRKVYQAEVLSTARLGHWVPTHRVILEESDFQPEGGFTVRNQYRREPYKLLSALTAMGRKVRSYC